MLHDTRLADFPIYRRAFLLLVAASCIACALPALASDVNQASLVRLQRATLTVADLEDTLAFYRDLLGFTERSRARYDTPSLRQIFPVPQGATPQLVLLDAGPDQPRALALVHAEGMTPDAQANTSGAPALLFNTRHMDRIHAAMVEADVPVMLPPTQLNDFSGNPFGREAAYLDPDGVRVILFEYE